MKICLLSYRGNPYSGGQGIYLKYLAEELVRQGHEVHVVVGPPYPEKIKGVTVHQIDNNNYFVKKGFSFINPQDPFEIFNPINAYEYFHSRLGAFSEISSFTYRAFLKIRSLQPKHNFDLIHDNQSLGYGLLLMKSLGIPVLATIHHPLTIDLENALERLSSFKKKIKTVFFYPLLMQRIVSPRLDHIITVSKRSQEDINKSFKVPFKKQSVVYNGLDLNIFSPQPEIAKEKRTLIFVGNVEDGKKGFIYLLRALKHLKKRVKLVVVDGGAPHRKLTSQIIKKLGVGDFIEFKGAAEIKDLVSFYSKATLAIVPSVYEGFGFPAAEAMACGTPVIASNGGALPEVVGSAGVVVEKRDEIFLARKIDELIDDEKRLKDMREAGLERVQKNFTWAKAVKDITIIYSRFVSS